MAIMPVLLSPSPTSSANVGTSVLAPALVLAKHDRESGALSADDEQFIVQVTRDIVEDLISARQAEPPGAHASTFGGNPVCCAAALVTIELLEQGLIENAARYSPRGSTIRLRTHRDLRSCRLDVVDSGDGIARKDLRNVFKMFWRADTHGPRRAGTGLGLYIVRSIVREHDGKVWAVSAGPGRGSTFSVRLPRVSKYWSLQRRRSLRARTEGRS